MRKSSFVLLLVLALPVNAHAESGSPPCIPGSITPNEPELPANLAAFRLNGGVAPFSMTPVVRLVQITSMGNVEVPVTLIVPTGGGDWEIRLDVPLEVGQTYSMRDVTCGDGSDPGFQFTVVDPVPPPTTLGVTTVSELRAFRPSPRSPLETYVRVRLELSPEAMAARYFYEGRWFTDGVQGSWADLEDFDDRVFVVCERSYPGTGVSEGTLTFAHEAREDVDPVLTSDGATVTIRCEDAVRVDRMTERPLTPEEIEAEDTIPDGGPPPPIDASGSDLDAGPPGTIETYDCSCRAAAGQTGRGPWLLVALGALVWLRRAARARRGR